MHILEVRELTDKIKAALDKPELQNVAVTGEVSNFKHHTSGHMYFSLKDETSRIRAVMFRSRNRSLNFVPQDGDMVVAVGSVGVYEFSGDYQLYVDWLFPAGAGALAIAFEQLKSKLEQEGLFDRAHKQQLPFLPRTVAVITSPTGAAVRDIISVARRRHPGINLLVIPALVQGADAPASLVRGLELAAVQPDVDVVIIGRGGGSFEDLAVFNDEGLARAIVHCPKPVISAVGHETDVTIADFVADVRAPTPSAAAELAVPSYLDLAERVKYLESSLQRQVLDRIKHGRRYLAQLERSGALRRPGERLRPLRMRVDELWTRLVSIAGQQVEGGRKARDVLVAKLDALSPLTTLARGYAICQDSTGRVVTSYEQVQPGQELTVRLKQGRLACSVLKGEEK
jgi:exodeoxyribonuclease VII large subunit